jgi:protoheme IX farnesyltransferase
MMLLSAGMVVDSWPVTRSAVAAVSGKLEPLVSLLPF